MGIIEIENLKKVYTTYERGSSFFDTLKSLFVRKKIEVHALKGISLEIEEGELLGFIGPNGAGKSTTLKILTGVLHPTSGHVSVMGFVPGSSEAHTSEISVPYSARNPSSYGISRHWIPLR
jgi:ABC-2 type transport system ATP-binding protein